MDRVKGVNSLLRGLTHNYHLSLLQRPEAHLAPTPNAPNGLHTVSTKQRNARQETNKGCICRCKANTPHPHLSHHPTSRGAGSSSTCSHTHTQT